MTLKTMSALAAVMAAGLLFAEEEKTEEASADEVSAMTNKPAKVEHVFLVLPFCQAAEGTAEILLPGDKEWTAAEEGKHYPLGTSYRTKGAASCLTVAFGAGALVKIEGDSSFGTQIQELGVKTRSIQLGGGTLSVEMPLKLDDGMFSVADAGFTAKNLAGESKFVQTARPDGKETVIRCVTGTMSLEGRQFSIAQMSAADELHLRTTTDNLETFLYGTSGDYVVKINKGSVLKAEVDDEGKKIFKNVEECLEWHLSPKTKVRISRLVPSVGERLSVSVMAFDTTGELKHSFAYSEGRPEVNTGETVPQETPAENAEKMKKAAAAAAEQTTTTAPAAEEKEEKSDDDDDKDSKNKNKKEEE